MAGDHAHAKQFSREARENFKTAEQLHAQAAEEILFSRNAGKRAHVFSFAVESANLSIMHLIRSELICGFRFV